MEVRRSTVPSAPVQVRGVSLDLEGMPRPPVVEPRRAADLEADLPADGLHPSHDTTGMSRRVDRHEVRDLGHALIAEEPGQEQIGVGQVELLVSRLLELGTDAEYPPALRVEQGGEHRRRVEVRQAEKVDRAVQTHQRRRLEVADDRVRLDRWVAPVRPPHAGFTAITPPTLTTFMPKVCTRSGRSCKPGRPDQSSGNVSLTRSRHSLRPGSACRPNPGPCPIPSAPSPPSSCRTCRTSAAISSAVS